VILILEDNEQRVRQFRDAAATIAPGVPVRMWHDAKDMMRDLVNCLEHARVISLDHDLVERPGASADPGTGYDVVKFLCELIPVCPLIVHTSNAERGTWMVGELSRSRWAYDRVYPLGDTWIYEAWAPAVSRMLKTRR
jgi:hypothetical protein